MIRAAVFLAGAAATAAMLWTIVANFGDEPFADLRRDNRLFSLGVLAFGLAGVLALPGVVLTSVFMRWPRVWLRRSYYTLLFLVVVANLLIFTTDAWRLVILFCWDCDLEVWWMQTIVPASLFIALAPPVKSLLAPHIGSQAEEHARDAGLLLRRVADSLLCKPAPGARAPRTTWWLATVPWLFWLAAAVMMNVRPVGDVMLIVIPGSYVAAFVLTLIATPLLGYRVFRDARQMSRWQKVWSLAGLAAGLYLYASVASDLRYIL